MWRRRFRTWKPPGAIVLGSAMVEHIHITWWFFSRDIHPMESSFPSHKSPHQKKQQMQVKGFIPSTLRFWFHVNFCSLSPLNNCFLVSFIYPAKNKHVDSAPPRPFQLSMCFAVWNPLALHPATPKSLKATKAPRWAFGQGWIFTTLHLAPYVVNHDFAMVKGLHHKKGWNNMKQPWFGIPQTRRWTNLDDRFARRGIHARYIYLYLL